MLLPKNKFKICLDPTFANHYQYDVKIFLDDSIDILSAEKNLDTYGILLPDIPQDFIDELVRTDISSRSVSVSLSNSNFYVPFDLIKLRKDVMFVDEGNGLLKIFLK